MNLARTTEILKAMAKVKSFQITKNIYSHCVLHSLKHVYTTDSYLMFYFSKNESIEKLYNFCFTKESLNSHVKLHGKDCSIGVNDVITTEANGPDVDSITKTIDDNLEIVGEYNVDKMLEILKFYKRCNIKSVSIKKECSNKVEPLYFLTSEGVNAAMMPLDDK